MAILYPDASALVKLVVDEEGSDLAEAVWNAADAVVASRLVLVEARAALAAAHRANRLRRAQLARCEQYLSELWAAVRPVELTESVTLAAGDLARRYGLRGADAVHLASALVVGVGEVLVAVWDRRLHSAVRRAGLTVAPASLG